MKTRIKKSPSTYPMFAVRMTAEKKECLNSLVESVRDVLNRMKKPDEKLYMKNDVIFEALMLGLPLLKETVEQKGKTKDGSQRRKHQV